MLIVLIGIDCKILKCYIYKCWINVDIYLWEVGLFNRGMVIIGNEWIYIMYFICINEWCV